MQEIDKLACVTKTLFDHRVLQQRREITEQQKEIEDLKKETLDNYYLVVFAESGSRTCDITIIPTFVEGDEFQTIAEMNRVEEMYDDMLDDLKAENISDIPDKITWVKELIHANQIVLIKLDRLIVNTLYVDPGHSEISIR